MAVAPAAWARRCSDAGTMDTQTQAAPLLDLRGVGRDFPAGEGSLTVLQDIELQIHAGEMVAIVGQSGSGKSTLMNLLGCLDQASRGHYAIAGREVGSLSSDELAELRREHFGFIFQRYHLLSDLTAQGNVEVPAVYAGSAGRGERHAPCPGSAGAAGPGRAHPACAGQALRRPAAAGVDRPGADERRQASSWPTSPPARWTAPPAKR